MACSCNKTAAQRQEQRREQAARRAEARAATKIARANVLAKRTQTQGAK